MSIVGLFTKNTPQIHGIYFDALLEESSELRTDVSEYPLEDASTANDNAVTRPLTLIMTVGVSDNWYRSLIAETGDLSSLAGISGSIATGALSQLLSGGAAAIAGLAASITTETMSDTSRSSDKLELLRDLQRNHTVMTVTGSKTSYTNMIITNTRTKKEKATEGGAIIVVEMRKLNIIDDASSATTSSNDTASTQATTTVNLGTVTAS